MTPEDVKVRLRRKLEEAFGAEEASLLMDRAPGGGSELVTVDILDSKLDALRSQMRAEIASVRIELAALSASVDDRLRQQTWVSTGTLISGLGLAFVIARFV